MGTLVGYFVLAVIRMIDVIRLMKLKLDIIPFVFNSVILVGEAVFASLNCHIYLVSAIALVLFVIVNYKFIKTILSSLIKKKI